MNPPIALVTGGARRIGRHLVCRLHRLGYQLIIHYDNSHAEAEKLVSELNAKRSGSAESMRADLSDAEQVLALANAVKTKESGLNVLINNASRFEPDPEPEDLATARNLLNIHALAPYLLARTLAEDLAKNSGSIINLIDIYAERPLKQHALYSSSKSALHMLTQSLAVELAPHVRVNGIAPGAILWPENGQDAGEQAALLQKIPLQRLGSVEAIGDTLDYILRCDYLTGQIINVDGGRSVTI